MSDYQHLLGRHFEEGTTDCYGLLIDYFHDIHGLTLTNYARPSQWWDAGLNLYMDNFEKEGFEVVHIAPHRAQVSDVFLLAIGSDKATHAGVFVGDNKILHHYIGRFSQVSPMNGIWRNKLCAIVRHKDIAPPPVLASVELIDLILPHKKQELLNVR